MPARPRFRLVAAAPMLGVLWLGACQQEPTGPSLATAQIAQPTPQTAKGVQGGCSSSGNAVVVFGLPNYPGPRTRLTADASGRLVVNSTGKGGNDDATVCTPLSGLTGIKLGLGAPFPFEGNRGDAALNIEFLYTNSPGGGLLGVQAGLRRKPNGQTQGFFDVFFGPGCTYTVALTRNGVAVGSRSGSGRIEFPLPRGYGNYEMGHVVGVTSLRGKNPAGNQWEATATPGSACNLSGRLAGMTYQFSGLHGASEPVSYIWYGNWTG